MTPIRSSPVSLPGTYLHIYLPRIAFVPLFLTHSNPHSSISIIVVIIPSFGERYLSTPLFAHLAE